MVLRRCHISGLKFAIWFLLIPEIAQHNKWKPYKWKPENGNQVDIHVGSAKYTFLI